MTGAARAGGAARAFRRRALTSAAAGVIAAAAVSPALAPAAAQAAKPTATGRVCAERAIVRETPGGLVIGVLEQDDAVRILKRGKDRAWVKVAVDLPAVGWIKAKALCGR